MNRHLARMGRRLAADRLKLTVMAALLLVGLLLWGRLLLLRKDVPKVAVAAPAVQPVKAADALKAAGEDSLPLVTFTSPATLTRDPFGMDDTGYARIAVAAQIVEVESKSPPAPVDGPLERHNAVKAAATGLALQTTMLGEDPKAVISGRMVRVGQVINGFLVREIHSRQVLLEKDGIEVRLDM